MEIRVTGAAEHNLQSVDVDIGDGLTVVTGVSGSGKTSLVFDTIYHEARRRFLDIYALGTPGQRLQPAAVRAISGLGPAVAVGQNELNRNPHSTLATAAGIHPFLRVLYAGFGARHCPTCGTPHTVLTEDAVISRIQFLALKGPVMLLAPLVRQCRGSHRTLLPLLIENFGAGSLRIDGKAWGGPAPPALDPARPHDIEVALGTVDAESSVAALRTLVQQAADLGILGLALHQAGRSETVARALVCTACGWRLADAAAVHFHTPCPHCQGAGCHRCRGSGLHPDAAHVRWQGVTLPELIARTVDDALRLLSAVEAPEPAGRLLGEISRRLEALTAVGLGYVGLDRPAPTLSRGEAQRVRLAVALSNRLEEILFVFDEPTIGQHPADVARFLEVLRRLPGPVICVEHERQVAAAADRVIDLGPGAGPQGGRVIFAGTPADLWQAETPTGRAFSLRQRVHPSPQPQPPPPIDFLTIRGARLRTLQQIDVPLPLGRLTAVAGVSGSGKSTLVEDVLVASLRAGEAVGCEAVEGRALQPVWIDQDPIGRNPRSNPATYSRLADIIRDLFAAATGLSPSHFSFNRPEGACPDCQGIGAVEVRMRYLAATWITCAACEGRRFNDEVLAHRVSFGERRLSIADLYELTIDQVRDLFQVETPSLPESRRRAARRILRALADVGLGYLALGQPSTTLSGGEAQRVKLSRYLGRKALGAQLLVLDEPTTGLHLHDLAGLLAVLSRLVRAGATVVVVEHNLDLLRAADWVVELGPGAGPAGGQLLYAGPPEGLAGVAGSPTGQALRDEPALRPRATPSPRSLPVMAPIAVRQARAHNLRDVDVDFPRARLTVVTGVSGSGKSSLVHDVLEAEARRRFLETLSLYERQSIREGPEAPVGAISGLGVTLAITADRARFSRRAVVGTATELAHHLALLLAVMGRRACDACGTPMERHGEWRCPRCAATAPPVTPRHFSASTYAAACPHCNGVGSLQVPAPEKLIVNPERPLCGGALYSPGFFPQGYLCKPYNGGYDMVRALAAALDFDPVQTPWQDLPAAVQQAFLFGTPEELEVRYENRQGKVTVRRERFPGFYGWIRDWDVGGTYTNHVTCPACGGARLRPEYLAVTLDGLNVHQLSQMPLRALLDHLEGLDTAPFAEHPVLLNLDTARRRLRFLDQVGLGYLHLDRVTGTLSAGESQRVRLAGLLGSGLTALAVLLDEPTRGMHPSEVEALLAALLALRDEGNTVIVVEHDPLFMRAADYLVDMGPGAGTQGGHVVARGTPDEVLAADSVTARWLNGTQRMALPDRRRAPRAWLRVAGARAHNLRGDPIAIPLGTLAGICGVSGSGKSTLLLETVGRALVPRKQTTSVAYEPVEPGAHDAITGAPGRAILLDQSRRGIGNPLAFLKLSGPLLRHVAATADARALGLDEKRLAQPCTACKGRGLTRLEMGFLPAVRVPCDACEGSGFRPETRQVRWRGVTLPELGDLTLDEVFELLGDVEPFGQVLGIARDVGLGYLALRQPGQALSGGETQRLRLTAELCRKTRSETLYLLDEPTVGQSLEDVSRLLRVLQRLVDQGHTVVVIEHHVQLLAACDWLVELGPGGGPAGGRVVARGTPETVAAGESPTAPYLRAVLEARR